MGFLEGARRLRRLKELPRLGQYATAALDASVWLHQLATGVDAVASMKGNYQPLICCNPLCVAWLLATLWASGPCS